MEEKLKKILIKIGVSEENFDFFSNAKLNSFNIEIIGFVFVILSLALTIISGVDYFVKSKDVLKDM